MISYKVAFTGHRPNGLYGYDMNAYKYIELELKIEQTIRWLIQKYGSNDFYTGGALGFDTLVAIATTLFGPLESSDAELFGISELTFKNHFVRTGETNNPIVKKIATMYKEISTDIEKDILSDMLKTKLGISDKEEKKKETVNKSLDFLDFLNKIFDVDTDSDEECDVDIEERLDRMEQKLDRIESVIDRIAAFCKL